jgi:L-seryl-tRNA(Ser) seleniumtransferase
VGGGYTNLEYDVDRGARGRRDVHADNLIARLTGAEAAVVVNNNAAATMLLLAALASGREVIISRGELVEIGGGFACPT